MSIEPTLPCACGRERHSQQDHASIRALKKRVSDPEVLGYIEELESLWAYAKRQGNVWRGIASAMGYEPDAHDNVKPTSPWLLERIERFRSRITSIPAPSGEVVERLDELWRRMIGNGWPVGGEFITVRVADTNALKVELSKMFSATQGKEGVSGEYVPKKNDVEKDIPDWVRLIVSDADGWAIHSRGAPPIYGNWGDTLVRAADGSLSVRKAN